MNLRGGRNRKFNYSLAYISAHAHMTPDAINLEGKLVTPWTKTTLINPPLVYANIRCGRGSDFYAYACACTSYRANARPLRPATINYS